MIPRFQGLDQLHRYVNEKCILDGELIAMNNGSPDFYELDMNNFYASVECLYNPSLRDKPLAVSPQGDSKYGYRFGHYAVQRGIALIDTELSHINPIDDHIIHPTSFI
ncbi:hypothetical protein [Metaclostridioides mangenotii]|uniref:Y-family DNA polymerase n=1 Tax=Metaclostridioides mangenotii TaxID=1540 RepID=UPI002F3E9387